MILHKLILLKLIQAGSVIFCSLTIVTWLLFPITLLYKKYYNFKASQYAKYCQIIFAKPTEKWTDLDLKILKKINHNLLYYLNHGLDPSKAQIVLSQILLPWARKNYKKSNWQIRCEAALIFSKRFEKKDYACLKSLMQDRVLLVSLTAMLAVIIQQDRDLFPMIIDLLSKTRYLRQVFITEFFQQHLMKADFIIIGNELADDLLQDYDDDHRIFCYSWLVKLNSYHNNVLKQALQDRLSDKMNLKISASHYLALNYKNQHLIIQNLKDKRWQVRVAAMHDLIKYPKKELIPILEKQLKHAEWWVRHTAKHAIIYINKAKL